MATHSLLVLLGDDTASTNATPKEPAKRSKLGLCELTEKNIAKLPRHSILKHMQSIHFKPTDYIYITET